MQKEIAVLNRQQESTIEQYEVLAEEQKAGTEEMQALNEELRTAAEEQETAREELQAVNEELLTVNQELKIKVDETTRANSDLQNLMVSTDIATIFLDRRMQINRYTPKIEQIFNIIPSDIGRPLAHLTHRLEYTGLVEDAGKVLGNLTPLQREIKSSGDGEWYIVRVLPYRSLEDRIDGIVITFTGITERKHAEEAIEDDLKTTTLLRELGVRLIQEGNAQVVYGELLAAAINLTHADAGTIQILDESSWNLVILATRGLKPEMTGHFRQVDAGPNTSCGVALATGTRTFIDYDVPQSADPDGSLRMHLEAGYLSAQSTPLVTRSGKPIGMVSTHWRAQRRPTERELRFLDLLARLTADLIERNQFQQALQESEEKYRTLFTTMGQGFCILELVQAEPGQPSDYRYIVANPAFERHTGMEDVVGKTIRELVPDAEQSIMDIYDLVISTGKSQQFEAYVSGLDLWMESEAFPTQQPGQLAVLFSNISKRRMDEKALRDSEQNLQGVANIVPDLLWFSEPDGTTTWYNERWFEYTGQTFAEATGWGWIDAIHPDDRESSARRYREAVEQVTSLVQQHRIRSARGEYRWFLARGEPLIDAEGRVTRMYGAATDIHEQQLTLEELERRVEARTGELAASNSQLIVLNDQLHKERERLHQLSIRLLEVQETERRYLAKELHDEIGQYLTGLKFQLAINERLLSDQPDQGRHFADTIKTVDELTTRVRELSLNLRPTLLDDMGILPALVSHIQQYTAQTQILVNFYHSGLARRFRPEVETTVYRLVQEALTNIARHAGVNHVLVQIRAAEKDHQLTVLVQDEGGGFELDDVLAKHSSTGISAMRERIELVGGQFTIESSPGEGTTVIAEIPIEP